MFWSSVLNCVRCINFRNEVACLRHWPLGHSSRCPLVPTYTMEQSPSWEANRFSASQEIPCILGNPGASLPHSQLHATCPYPEPARSSPYPHIPLPEDPFNITLPSMPVFQVVSFLQVSPPKPCISLSSVPYMLHAMPIFNLYICWIATWKTKDSAPNCSNFTTIRT